MASATVAAAVASGEDMVGQARPVGYWPLAAKVAFRFSFLYLMLYMFLNGNVTIFTILEPFPKIEGWIAKQLFTPLARVTQWWAVRALHLTGMAATWHHDGSGDTLLNYLLCVTFLAVAVVGTGFGRCWTGAGRTTRRCMRGCAFFCG